MQLCKCLYITYDNFINKNMEINRDTKYIEQVKQERERERERERESCLQLLIDKLFKYI